MNNNNRIKFENTNRTHSNIESWSSNGEMILGFIALGFGFLCVLFGWF